MYFIVRPQSVTITETEVVKNNHSHILKGKIEYSEFLGETVRYSVLCNGHSILADESHWRGNKIIANGQDVWVVITMDQVLLLDQ